MTGSAVIIKDERKSGELTPRGSAANARGAEAPSPPRDSVPQSDRRGISGEDRSPFDRRDTTGENFALSDRLVKNRGDGELSAVLSLLPPRIARAARQSALSCGALVSEIRIRRGAPASVTAGGRNLVLPVSATDEEIASALRSLCDRSLYAKAATIWLTSFLPSIRTTLRI